MKKRLLSFLLAVIMVASAIPCIVVSTGAVATDDPIDIAALSAETPYYHNGEGFNAVAEGANAVWNAAESTLTLNGLALAVPGTAISGDEVKIVLAPGSENSIFAENAPCITGAVISIVSDEADPGSLSLQSTGPACALDANAATGDAALTVEDCTLTASSVRATSAQSAAITINGATVTVDSTGTTAPCALGVYAAYEDENIEEEGIISINNSTVNVKNGYTLGQCLYVRTTNGAHTGGANYGEPGATKGGAATIKIKDSTVNADNMAGTLSNATAYRTGAMFLLSFGTATTEIDHSNVTLRAQNTYTYGFSSQVANKGQGKNVVTIKNGSKVDAAAYCGFDLRGWGNAFDNQLTVTDSTLIATGYHYEGVYVNASKSGAGGAGNSMAIFENSLIVSRSTGYGRGLSVRDKNGNACFEVKGGALVVGDPEGTGVYTGDGLAPDYTNAGVIVTETYANGNFTGTGEVYNDVTLPAGFTVAAGEKITLDLKGKTVSGAIANNGALTVKDTVGGGCVAADIVSGAGAATHLIDCAFTGTATTDPAGEFADMISAPVFTPAGGVYTDPVEVALSASGAEIRYTLDGTEPTAASTLYEAPIAVADVTTVIRAKAFRDGKESETVKAAYIYDGTLSTEYTALEYLEAKGNSVIKTPFWFLTDFDTIVTDAQFTSSANGQDLVDAGANAPACRHWGIYNGTYSLEGGCDLAGIDVLARQQATMTVSAANATLTVGGTTATRIGAIGKYSLYFFGAISAKGSGSNFASAKLYSVSLGLGGDTVAAFLPVRRNSDGAVGLYETKSAVFYPLVTDSGFAVVPSVPAGNYETAQTVALTSDPGAIIRYTLDGTDPQTSATAQVYSAPITVSASCVLRAVASDNAGYGLHGESFSFAYIFAGDGDTYTDIEYVEGGNGKGKILLPYNLLTDVDKVVTDVQYVTAAEGANAVDVATSNQSSHFGVYSGKLSLEGGAALANADPLFRNTVVFTVSATNSTLTVGGETVTRNAAPAGAGRQFCLLPNAPARLYSVNLYKGDTLVASLKPAQRFDGTVGMLDEAGNFYPLTTAAQSSAPVISVSGKATDAERTVTISANAPVYYSLDGSNPVPNGTLYTEPIRLRSGCEVRAIALGEVYSSIVSEEVDIYIRVDSIAANGDSTLTLPFVFLTGFDKVITDARFTSAKNRQCLLGDSSIGEQRCKHWGIYGGAYSLEGGVSLSATDVPLLDRHTAVFTVNSASATLTVDGKSATRQSAVDASGKLTLFGKGAYSANAILYGAEVWKGDVQVAHLIPAWNGISYGLLDTLSETFYPVTTTGSYTAPALASVRAGSYTEAQTVALTSANGETIYYTLDGTEPTTESAVYTEPIVLNKDTTLRTLAVKDGQYDSSVATYQYTIEPQPTLDTKLSGKNREISLSLLDNVNMVFKVKNNDGNDLTGYTDFVLVVTDTDGNEITRVTEWKEGSTGDNYWCAFEVQAADINTNFKFHIEAKNANGEDVYGKTLTYGVGTYCAALKATTDVQELKDLCDAIVAYGTAAANYQAYLDSKH